MLQLRPRARAYARWFDIDWSRGRLLLPVLGDDFDAGPADGRRRRAALLRAPLPARARAPSGGTAGRGRTPGSTTSWSNFRRADTEQNYRRFFAVATLAGLRVEDPAVFDATHAQIAPLGARRRHRRAARRPPGRAGRPGRLPARGCASWPARTSWLTVEKILEPGEAAAGRLAGRRHDRLRRAGRGAAALFVDPAAEAAFDALYRELTGDQRDVRTSTSRPASARRSTTILQAEVSRLARLVPDVDGRRATRSPNSLVHFPVYRSYLPDRRRAPRRGDRRGAAPPVPTSADAIGALAARLADPADELCARFQQIDRRGDGQGRRGHRVLPLHPLRRAERGRRRPGAVRRSARRRSTPRSSARQETLPRSMTTLSTHDTKRGEDVRARLAVLAELPDEWAALAAQPDGRGAARPTRRSATCCGRPSSGAGLIERDRMHAYAEKAMREAAQSHDVDRPGRGVRARRARGGRPRLRRPRRARPAGRRSSTGSRRTAGRTRWRRSSCS